MIKKFVDVIDENTYLSWSKEYLNSFIAEEPKAANIIFVFGSNLAGRHGAGAALFATRFLGAKYGVGAGLTGNTYAIPTKDEFIETMPLSEIKGYVDGFIKFAKQHPDLKFVVTKLGCGLAGYVDEDVAPLFSCAPSNCLLPATWERILLDLTYDCYGV